MALVNGGFLHYMDMKKFLKNLLLRNRWSDFKIISQECYLGDPFQKLFRDMKKFLKNLLLQNCWSDFEIISQECFLGDPFVIAQCPASSCVVHHPQFL